jgi:hypothetical protein
MNAAETGTNWSAIPGFIPEKLATSAGREALFLCALSRRALVNFVRLERRWDNRGLTVVTVDHDKLAASPVSPIFKALQEVYKLTEDKIGNQSGDFYVNRYGSGGSTKPHIDREAKATLAVSLAGQAEAVIQDPERGECTITLNPTDAIYFDNSVPELERPLHVVRNTLVRPRTALVNG